MIASGLGSLSYTALTYPQQVANFPKTLSTFENQAQQIQQATGNPYFTTEANLLAFAPLEVAVAVAAPGIALQGAVGGAALFPFYTGVLDALNGQPITSTQLVNSAMQGAAFGEVAGPVFDGITGLVGKAVPQLAGITQGIENLPAYAKIPIQKAFSAGLGAATQYAFSEATTGQAPTNSQLVAAAFTAAIAPYVLNALGQLSPVEYNQLSTQSGEQAGVLSAKIPQVATSLRDFLVPKASATGEYDINLPEGANPSKPLFYSYTDELGQRKYGFGSPPLSTKAYVNPATLTQNVAGGRIEGGLQANPSSSFAHPIDVAMQQDILNKFGTQLEAEEFALNTDLANTMARLKVAPTENFNLELKNYNPEENAKIREAYRASVEGEKAYLKGSNAFKSIYGTARQGADIDNILSNQIAANRVAQKFGEMANSAFGAERFTAKLGSNPKVYDLLTGDKIYEAHYPGEPLEDENVGSLNPTGANFGIKGEPLTKAGGVKVLEPGRQVITKISSSATPRIVSNAQIDQYEAFLREQGSLTPQIETNLNYLKSLPEGSPFEQQAGYRIKDNLDKLGYAKIVSDTSLGGQLDPKIMRLAQISVEKGTLSPEDYQKLQTSTPQQLADELSKNTDQVVANFEQAYAPAETATAASPLYVPFVYDPVSQTIQPTFSSLAQTAPSGTYINGQPTNSALASLALQQSASNAYENYVRSLYASQFPSSVQQSLLSTSPSNASIAPSAPASNVSGLSPASWASYLSPAASRASVNSLGSLSSPASLLSQYSVSPTPSLARYYNSPAYIQSIISNPALLLQGVRSERKKPHAQIILPQALSSRRTLPSLTASLLGLYGENPNPAGATFGLDLRPLQKPKPSRKFREAFA